MAFGSDALILINYTARIKDTGEVFDTTIMEEAEKHHLHDHDAEYRPKLVSIGNMAYPVLKGLDEALAGMEVGDNLSVEVSPDKGFGMRDPKKLRMIPTRKLGEDADKVSVGDTVKIDDKPAIIRLIGSGRTQIDYNHKYAGKTIVYDVSIVKELSTDSDKIEGIIEKHFSLDRSEFVLDLDDEGEATILIPDANRQGSLDQEKTLIQSNVFKFVPSLSKFNFLETYNNPNKVYDMESRAQQLKEKKWTAYSPNEEYDAEPTDATPTDFEPGETASGETAPGDKPTGTDAARPPW